MIQIQLFGYEFFSQNDMSTRLYEVLIFSYLFIFDMNFIVTNLG